MRGSYRGADRLLAALGPLGTPFFWILVVGSLLRLWLSTLGHNYDMDSFFMVASRFLNSGNPPYEFTNRYNYGPVWYHVLAGLRAGQLEVGPPGKMGFHVWVVAALTANDVVLALWLRRRFDSTVAVFFFLSPVVVLCTGYHSQFDLVALSVAFFAAGWFERRRFLIGSTLVGASLAIKHVLFAFPAWIALWLLQRGARLRTVLTCAAAPVLIFLLSFAPYAGSPDSIAGISKHVFSYRGLHPNGLINPVARLTGLRGVMEWIPDWIPVVSGTQGLSIGLVVLTGWALSGERAERWLVAYPLAMFAFAVFVADQYLVFATVAAAVYWRSPWSWLYWAAATFALAISHHNIGRLAPQLRAAALEAIQPLQQQQIYWVCQFAAVMLVVAMLRDARRNREQRQSGAATTPGPRTA